MAVSADGRLSWMSWSTVIQWWVWEGRFWGWGLSASWRCRNALGELGLRGISAEILYFCWSCWMMMGAERETVGRWHKPEDGSLNVRRLGPLVMSKIMVNSGRFSCLSIMAHEDNNKRLDLREETMQE